MADRRHFLNIQIFFCSLLIICIVYFIILISLEMNNRSTYEIGTISNKDDVLQFNVNLSILRHEITVVTAYFNLGTISKGTEGNYITERIFFRWAKSFRHLDNPLIVYTDCKKFLKFMNSIRKSGKTAVRLINRKSSWAFQNEEKVLQIVSRKDYPKFVPNTVNSAYICTQHAKYDVIKRAALENPCKTKYFAWIDIGYFRNRTKNQEFYLEVPPDFDNTRIAANQVFEFNPNLEPDKIFKENRVWIGGGLFLGERGVIIKYADQFRSAVNHFLTQDLVNTDQQTLFAMYSNSGKEVLKPHVHVQLYCGPETMDIEDRWFYLGYKMISNMNRMSPAMGKQTICICESEER